MKEGTAFLVGVSPGKWPVDNKVTILSSIIEGTVINLIANPDGHIQIEITDDNGKKDYFDTQILKYSGIGNAIYTLAWNKEGIILRINGDDIKSFNEAGGEIYEIKCNHNKTTNVPSYFDIHAKSTCHTWMEWRKNKFSNYALQRGRRIKTDQEQIQELTNAISSLKDIHAMILQGKDYMLGHLAAELRALVYWSDKRIYNPLLLRLADRYDIPLPIYFLPQMNEDEFEIKERSILHLGQTNPSIYKTLNNHQLVDLQEWLSATILILRKNQGTKFETKDNLSVKEFIRDVAVILGCAHYDIDISATLDQLSKIIAPQGDQVKIFLLMITSIVVELGGYILKTIFNETNLNTEITINYHFIPETK